MPPAIIAAAVVGTAAVGSSLISANASKKAANAANTAADQNAAVNREIYNQTRSDLSPYNQAGQAGLSALMQRLGLAPVSAPGGAPQPAPQAQATGNPSTLQGGPTGTPNLAPPGQEQTFEQARAASESRNATAKAAGGPAGTSPLAAPPPVAQPQGGPDWAAYAQQNPDIAAQAVKEGRDPAEYAQAHFQAFGPREGAPVPTMGAQTPPADPNAPPPQYYQEAYAPREDAAPVPQYGSAPTFSMNYEDIANDPGFKFETGETAAGVNANAAARGGLRSGDAAKALQDRLFGVAHKYGQDYFNRGLAAHDRNYQGFIDDRSYGTNLALQNRTRQDNIFSEDRGFQAGRNDQQTSNLFGVAGIGQNAAAGTASAGNVFAQNQIASNNQRANTTANAAIANAQNTTNLFGSAANAAGAYFGMQGGGGGGLPRTYSI